MPAAGGSGSRYGDTQLRVAMQAGTSNMCRELQDAKSICGYATVERDRKRGCFGYGCGARHTDQRHRTQHLTHPPSGAARRRTFLKRCNSFAFASNCELCVFSLSARSSCCSRACNSAICGHTTKRAHVDSQAGTSASELARWSMSASTRLVHARTSNPHRPCSPRPATPGAKHTSCTPGATPRRTLVRDQMLHDQGPAWARRRASPSDCLSSAFSAASTAYGRGGGVVRHVQHGGCGRRVTPARRG